MPRAAEERRRRERRRRRRGPRGEALPRLRLLDLAPALLGDADPDRPLRELRRRCRSRSRTCRCVLPRDIEPTGEGNPLAERPDFVDVDCPRCGEPAKRETDTLDCHFDALWLWVPAAVPPEARAEQMFTHPDLRRWLPSERLVAGNDSGSFVFDQRVVTKALRDIGPFAFLEDGEPFAGCLFHEMVVADGRKMSKHLGNVVDPDELVERYGADTVRLAILYAAGPAKTLNWNDGAMRFASRFLNGLWDYALDRFAAVEEAPRRRGGRGRHRASCASGWANGATTASRGSPPTSTTCRCTRRCATSPGSSSGSRTTRSGSSSAAARSSRADAEALAEALVLLAAGPRPLRPALRRGAADRRRARGGRRVAELLASAGRVAILIRRCSSFRREIWTSGG